MKISEIIIDKYKLQIPPNVYYDLLADVREAEEEQEPCEDAVSRHEVAKVLLKYAHSAEGKAFAEFLVGQINDLPSINPQKPKSEWQHDHEILKAYSDGANEVLDKIRLDIAQEIIPRNSDIYDWEARWQNIGLRIALKVIDKYKAEGSNKE